MVGILLIIFLSQGGNLKVYRERLDSLSKELQKVRKEKAQIERKRYGIMEMLEKINQEEDILREVISKIEKQISFMEEEKAKKIEIIGKIKEYLDESKEDIKKGIIFLYKRANVSPLNLILYGGSPYTFYSGIKALSTKLKEEKVVLNKGIELLQELETRVESLRVREENLALLKESFEKRKGELVLLRIEKEKFLEERKKDERERERLIAELRKNMKRLNSIIRELEKRTKGKLFAKGFPKNVPKRNFSWPCNGKIYNSFGSIWHPLYKTRIKNNGVDILSEYDGKVKAAGSGVIEYANDFLGYGKLIIIDHGDGFFTIYGNLKDTYVVPGKAVREGEIIGVLGKDPLENLPLLHFEIRYGGKALDPLYFLKEAL